MVASLIDEKPWAVLMAWALDDVVARRIRSSDTFCFHVFFFLKGDIKILLAACFSSLTYNYKIFFMI